MAMNPTHPTLTSGCSTPTTGPNGHGGYSVSGTIFPSRSPSLILVFLAVGLFVVTMTGILGWRRISRSWESHQPVTTNREPKSIPLDKKPILWDVWADLRVRETSPVKVTRWEHMTPLTAVLTFLIPRVRPLSVAVEPSCPPIGSVDSSGRVTPFRMLRCLVSALLDPPPPPPPLPPVALLAPRLSDEIERGDTATLHVSVIVTMPTQRWCCNGPLETVASPKQGGLGDFCIGTMDVPWRKGG